MSLRRQFTLALVALSVLLTAGGGWLAWHLTSGTLERQLDEKLTWVAGAAAEAGLQSTLVLDLQPGDEVTDLWRGLHQRLRRLQRYVSDAYIFRRGNTALVTTSHPDSIPIGTSLHWLDAYPETLEEAWTTGEATTPLFEGVDGRFYKYGFVQLEQSDAMLAVLMRADYLQPLNRFRRTLLIGTFLGAVLAAGIGGVLAKNVTRPLERLSRVALRIQRGHLDEPVVVERGDELGRLSRAMERMRVGIVQRDEQLRLMLAQVAHEIRNPLGGLDLFASAAAETEDPDERRRLLDRVSAEVMNLNQIINDFLAVARPLEPELELHDITAPVHEAAGLVRAELEREGGTLEVELPGEPLLARADPSHVKRVVLNLMRNGAQAGSRVRVKGSWRNGEVVLSVQDDGPGVSEELRDRIFDPFVTDKEQGAGLGLTIVRKVVEANGGRVELATATPEEKSYGNGAEFRVYLRGAEEFPDSGNGEEA